MGPISCGSSHSQVVFALVPRTQCRVWKQQARCCWQSCFSWDGPLLQHGKAFGSWAQLPAAWEQCCGCLVCNTERTWVRESVMDLESGGCRSPSASAGLLEPCVLPARSGRDRAVQRQEAGEQRGVRRAARLSPGRLR